MKKLTDNRTVFSVLLIILITVGILVRIQKWSNFDKFAGDQGFQLLSAEHMISYSIFPENGEISALDQNNKFIFHKSSLGLYMSAIAYLLGQKSPEGYFFVYLCLNLISAWLLYLTASSVFSRKAGILVLLFAIFSPLSIELSAWPSQPSNAIFLETISLFLLSKYLQHKNNKDLLFSLLLSQAAFVIYPPHLLIVLPKFILIMCVYNQEILSRKFLITLGILSGLIYFPSLYSQFHHNFYDVKLIFQFVTQLQNSSTAFSINNIFSTLHQQVVNVISGVLLQKINTVTTQPYVLLLTAILFIAYIKKNIHNRKYVINSIFSLWFFSIFVIAYIYSAESATNTSKAYLTTLLPYTLLLFGVIFSILNKRSLLFITAIYLLFFVPAALKSKLFYNKLPTISAISSITSKIYKYQESNFPDNSISIFVVSAGDSWGWDNTVYWYNLEKLFNKQLAEVDFYSGKFRPIDTNAKQSIYLICHGINKRFSQEVCVQRFEAVATATFGYQLQPIVTFAEPNIVSFSMDTIQ